MDGPLKTSTAQPKPDMTEIPDAKLQTTKPHDTEPQKPGPEEMDPVKAPAPLRYRVTTDDVALAIKTGEAVIEARLPAQLATFLRRFPHTIVASDSSNVSFGSVPIYDVTTHQLELARARLARKPAAKRDEDDSPRGGWHQGGWLVDTKKNMPGFLKLYQEFPDKKWYIMADDDTYFFADALMEALSSYDPQGDYYMGTTYGVAGDHEKKFPMLAYGGNGIFISRGAFMKLLTVMDQCIVDTQHIQMGDTIVAMCLDMVGIRINRTFPAGRLNRMSPNLLPRQPPCEHPINYHHVTAAKMFHLDEVERSARGQTTFADVFHSISLPYLRQNRTLNVYKMEGVDLPGSDFFNSHAPAADACQAMCMDDLQCVSWSFVTNTQNCFLKSALGRMRYKADMVSGFVPEHYVCST